MNNIVLTLGAKTRYYHLDDRSMVNKRKRRPTHPGEILREDILPAARLRQDKLAKFLGVSRRTISEILHERRPVTTDMAHRLARAFGTSPEIWRGLQQDVDLWDTHHARCKEYDRIKRVATPKAA
jgi:addiction module HigA family antidote